MGLTAGIHAISRTSYDAAIAANPTGFEVDTSVESIDLDKAWHAIHYLTTGDASLTFLLSGSQIGGVPEHCEVHAPESLKALDLELAARSLEDIMSGFRADIFAELQIYPDGWSNDMTRYVAQHLERFLRKLHEIVEHGLGMLVVIH